MDRTGSPLIYTAYRGSSMNPTLVEPELLEIIPYADERLIRKGDVILFLAPGGSSSMVHRVMRVTCEGILTRGDHNRFDDAQKARAAQLRGRVVAARYGNRRRTVHGGPAGLAWHYFLRLWLAIDRHASSVLSPPYRALSRSGLMRRWLPAKYRPRVMAFQDKRLLMLGSHVIGRYDLRQRKWQVKRPFRLICVPTEIE
jgi:signal peptidase I